MLLQSDQCAVLLIDVQEKLTPYVQRHQYLVNNCFWVLELAKALELPYLISEHYPKGLGGTVPTLSPFKNTLNTIKKVHFSCAKDKNALQQINTLNKKQILLMGIETHVCVLQTALVLQQENYSMFVVADAVSSRSTQDHELGLARMRQNGIQILTKEMLFFECLERATTDKFKTLSKRFMKA